ncbi:hypothetical protein ACFL3D_01840 [Candidatus Omnitrophota bacterium]
MKLHDFHYKYHDEGDAVIDFEISDADEAAASPQYAGYLAPTGAWIITKITIDAGITNIRFATGKEDYSTNWTGRAALSYGYLDAIF